MSSSVRTYLTELLKQAEVHLLQGDLRYLGDGRLVQLFGKIVFSKLRVSIEELLNVLLLCTHPQVLCPTFYPRLLIFSSCFLPPSSPPLPLRQVEG